MKQRAVIADLNAIDGVPCPCGTARRAFAALPGAPCTLHVTEIARDARAHYHKRHTEVYYFLDGEGQIELDGELHPVRPGVAVLIPPGVRHRAVVGEAPMRIINFVLPPFDPEDEWFD